MTVPSKLAIVVSHPIQHFAPFYRALASHEAIDLVVVFSSRIGVKPYFDKGMNTLISWNMDLLGGYDHVFLPEADAIASTSPLQVNNPSIAAELDRQRPDVVLIYGYNQMTSLRALWWCRANNVPAMMISDSELKAPRSTMTKLVKRGFVPIVLHQFKCFLTVGDCNEDAYRHYGVSNERLFRSPFTIDEASYLPARKDRAILRAQARAKHGVSESAIVALTVGKLTERKRARDILDAARKLRADGNAPNLLFMLAGNGPLMTEFEATVRAENLPVKLPGFVNVDELPSLYAAADVIVHPSARDPHPLVMSEAACVGLPLIISDRVGAAGPTDIARPGDNAVVFPCGDIEAMASAIRQLASEHDLRDHMGRNSLRCFDELDMKRSVQGAVDAVAFCVGDARRETSRRTGT